MICKLGVLMLGLSLIGAASAAETIRYVAVVAGGKQAGHQTIVRGDDGVTRTEFFFKDNGRGPELKEEFTLAPDGTFRSYRVKGSSTFGAPVDESFSRVGTKAQWKTQSDRGEQAVEGTAQYWTLDGTFAEPGKRADLILVDGDPTTNISDIRKVALVVKGDTAYAPSEIYEALGIAPFTASLPISGSK